MKDSDRASRTWSSVRQLGSRVVSDLALAVALALPLLFVALVGTRGPAVATLNLGPNDAAYVRGFKPELELDSERAVHWSRHEASIDLPLWVQGDTIELALRLERAVAGDGRVRVFVGRRLVDAFVCRSSDGIRVRRIAFSSSERTRLRVALSTDGPDLRDLGLRLDWISVGVSPRTRMGLDGATVSRLAFVVCALFLIFRLAGFGRRLASGLLVPLSLGIAAWAWIDPLVPAHLALKLWLSTIVVTGMGALLLRRQPAGRWALACLALAYLLKGGGVFHPHFFYPDIQVHRRFVYEMRGASGTLTERGREAQRKLHQAYRVVGGTRGYNFPYSPLFYAPFIRVHWAGPESVDDAMRHVGLVAAASEVLLVFWIGSMLAGANAAALAAFLVALLPVSYSRLLYGMWPTLTGHALDVLVVALAARCLLAPERRWRWMALALAALAACLIYVGSLFTVSLFLVALALCEIRRAPILAGIAAAASAATVALMYRPFVAVLWSEIVPAIWHGAALTGAPEAGDGSLGALARVPLFYGWAYPLLAAAGLLVARRRLARPAFQILLAGAMTYAALLGLRALPGGMFRDVKESTFVAPFIALATALTLMELARRGRHGRWAAAMIVLGLAAFGLSEYAGYFATYGMRAVAVAEEVPAPPLGP